MKNIVAIVQARMTSSRLPNKVLMDLGKRTVVGQVFNQLSYSKMVNKVVLATSDDVSDDPLENWAVKNNVEYFRGDLNNVLKRFYDTAKEYTADIIIRITADCPLIDPEIVDSVIKVFLEGGYDYFSNTNPPTFPDGLDTEVFTFKALEKAFLNAELLSEIEHVTPYLRNHPEVFKIGNYLSSVNYENLRWTIDNKEDYEFLKNIFNNLNNNTTFIGWKQVIEFLSKNEEIQKINSHIQRNEGFIKSLNEDKKIK